MQRPRGYCQSPWALAEGAIPISRPVIRRAPFGLAFRSSSFLPPSTACSGVRVAKRCMVRAMRPVQPVWWLAPRPAPLSPWKYS